MIEQKSCLDASAQALCGCIFIPMTTFHRLCSFFCLFCSCLIKPLRFASVPDKPSHCWMHWFLGFTLLVLLSLYIRFHSIFFFVIANSISIHYVSSSIMKSGTHPKRRIRMRAMAARIQIMKGIVYLFIQELEFVARRLIIAV